MKVCPACNRTYDDDTLSFCLVDGSALSTATSPPAVPRDTEPPPTQQMHTAQIQDPRVSAGRSSATLPSYTAPVYQPPVQARGSSNKRALIWVGIGVAGLAVVLIGIAVGIVLLAWQGGANTNTANSQENSSWKRPGASPQVTRTPAPTPTPTPSIDLRGEWSGRDARSNRMNLSITEQTDGAFSGVISDPQGTRVAVNGSVNALTRDVTMLDVRFIEKKTSWALGTYAGKVSEDGKKLTLRIRDMYGVTSATFTRR